MKALSEIIQTRAAEILENRKKSHLEQYGDPPKYEFTYTQESIQNALIGELQNDIPARYKDAELKDEKLSEQIITNAKDKRGIRTSGKSKALDYSGK